MGTPFLSLVVLRRQHGVLMELTGQVMQDIVNLMEYVNGRTDSIWGAESRRPRGVCRHTNKLVEVEDAIGERRILAIHWPHPMIRRLLAILLSMLAVVSVVFAQSSNNVVVSVDPVGTFTGLWAVEWNTNDNLEGWSPVNATVAVTNGARRGHTVCGFACYEFQRGRGHVGKSGHAGKFHAR